MSFNCTDKDTLIAYVYGECDEALRAEVESHLRALHGRLATVEPWAAAPLEAVLRGLAGELGVGAGKLIHPTRLAVTGRGASPGLFEVLELLGRDRTLARIARLLDRLAGH